MIVEFHPGALGDARSALLWYAERSEPAALRFEAELRRAVEFIGLLPSAGSPGGFGTRRHRLHGFPHALIYRVGSDSLLVLAVAHERREPGYWRGR